MNMRKILLGLLLSGALFNGVHAQEQPSLRKRADDLFNRLEFSKALPIYERLANAKKVKVGDFEKIGQGYLYLKQYELAENWYARAIQTEGHSKDALLGYAEALKQNGKYAEAKVQFQNYSARFGSSEKIQIELAGCDSATVWMANPLNYKLKNEKGINTDLSEFSAVPASNGVLYAAEPKMGGSGRSAMTGQGYLKVFAASRNDANLEMPTIMAGSFNGAAYHVGPILPNRNEDALYVTRTYPGKDAEKFKAEGVRFKKQNLELKIYKKNGNDWSEEDFAYNNVKEYSLGHAALSDDEKTLYFASDMPGGLGGVDIWFSTLQADGSWGKPVNAGREINSAGDEMFPTVLGNKLFYSSNGFPGMGGLDLFVAEGSNGNFKGRKNLQYPLNSASDDFSYVVAATDAGSNVYGYVSSNRIGGVGSDDIYSFNYTKPKIKIILNGFTYDKKTRAILEDSRVSLLGVSGDIIARKLSDGKGNFVFELDAGTAYRVNAEHTGYMSDSTRVAAVYPQRDTVINVALYLQPMYKAGDKIVLENIYYDFDKHNIRKDAADILDHLVRVMRDNPTMKVELSSHTDSRGSDSYNMRLSQNRATSAVEYVISRGISRDRIIAKGYGETRLVNKCSNGVSCTPAEHQANRRTEVEVLEF
ncbi:OmpA family protein [Sphingobacterium psychroaquaticum]|uniref:OmpA family protein n=2 Tax=Sphingobacterium psychroaquaticum TaxID=561061 RepID=A0A1X7K6U4_9SPHI|nr:OmpA family protein [Sphingobacterium psychroaquaticum]